MKIIPTILFILIINSCLSQDSSTIYGKYEYQTGATERWGQVLEILPNNKFKLLKNEYGIETQIDSGKWIIKADTLKLTSKTNLNSLVVKNENILSSIILSNKDDFFNICHWFKTIGYYPNGTIESTRKWKSTHFYNYEPTPHGIWTYYYPNQKLKSIKRYKNGKKKGKWIQIDIDGREVKSSNENQRK